MRRLYIFCALALVTTVAQAQVTLFSEDFSACALEPAWQVNITGNQSPTWYVASDCTNNDATATSMNGSCFLIIDDDAEGDGTPAYVIDFVSPAFDCSQHANVELTLDVHYRDWPSGAETFSLLITNGVDTLPLRSFSQNQSTGSAFDQFVTLKYDLSFFSQSANTRLIIRYDDGGGFNWWAGVDNIQVIGSGTGTNVVAEAFTGCEKPAGWNSEVLTGNDNWQFGQATQGGLTMDGSCFAFFDDDALGQAAPYSTARLTTPWFDGTNFGQFELNFDLIHRYHAEIFTVLVQHANGDEFIVQEWGDDVGGPNFTNYVHQTLDLSPYRNAQMRVVFQYADGNDWSWWSGVDNVKVTGRGAANDLCANATELVTGADCLPGDTKNAVFDGPLPTCGGKPVGGLWYKWQAGAGGAAELRSHAQFNDVISIFTGTCTALQEVACDDYDEHGFVSEATRFEVQSGQQYLIRVSGQDAPFGVPRGSLCVEIDQTGAAPPAPGNDDCATATPLTLGATCLNASNLHATNSTTIPSLNTLARADVWYQFVAPTLAANEQLELRSNADFSDVITVYSGGCNALNEVAGNHEGQSIRLSGLTPGVNYRVQIAGTFATVEGSLCPQIFKTTVNAPANDECFAAVTIPVGSQCTGGSNADATFSGLIPPCVPTVSRDVWFKFTAPASGSVRVNTGAEFEHVATVWKGACSNLEAVQCLKNPLRCEGYVTVGDLLPGQVYFLQIASLDGPGGAHSGDLCVKLLDGGLPPDVEPLTLQATATCVNIGEAVLNATATGGVAPFTFSGNAVGETLSAGTSYIVVVTDANGCEQVAVGAAPECTSGCFVNASATQVTPICGGAGGSLAANVTGGSEPYQFVWSNGATTQTINDLTAGGEYRVTVTDGASCTTEATVTLAAYPVIDPGLPNILQPTTGQSNGALSFVDNPAWTFEWTLNGQVVGNGPALNDIPAGDYTVVITNAGGCSMTLVVVLDEVSGVRNLQAAFQATLAPNPTHEQSLLTVAMPKATDLQVTLTDGNGRTLRRWSLEQVLNQQIRVDVRDLPGGVYWVRLVAEQGTVALRLVVAR